MSREYAQRDAFRYSTTFYYMSFAFIESALKRQVTVCTHSAQINSFYVNGLTRRTQDCSLVLVTKAKKYV